MQAVITLTLVFLGAWFPIRTGAVALCTRGRLFTSDQSSNIVRVYELDDSMFSQPISSLSVGPSQATSTRVYPSSTDAIVSVFYMGNSSRSFDDGAVSFVLTGVSSDVHGLGGTVNKVAPSVSAAMIQCVRPIHHVSHMGQIAAFCDGFFTLPQLNSSAYFVSEAMISSGDVTSSTRFSTNIQGTHHGVAVPIADGHYLISQPTPQRVARVPGASSLPNGFHIVNVNGDLIHSLNNDSDPQSSCIGFHGSGHIGNDFAFGCDQVASDPQHGGILLVTYDAGSQTYTSRKINYPQLPSGFRTGTIADNKYSSSFVGNIGNFRSSAPPYLVQFDVLSPPVMEESQLLSLPVRQCTFKFEKSGKHILVMMPYGSLLVYTAKPWTLMANVSVVPDMLSCTNVSLVEGHTTAYILDARPGASTAGQHKMYVVDLTNLALPSVRTVDLDYPPFLGAVAGVPKGHQCAEPLVPNLPPSSLSVLSGWIYLTSHGGNFGPGSAEMSNLIFETRRNISLALSAAVNQIYVLEVDQVSTGVYIHVAFAGEESSDLVSRFISQLGQPSSALRTMMALDESVSFESSNPNAPTDDDDDEDKLSDGAIAAIVVVTIVAGLAALAAIYFACQARQTRLKYEKAPAEAKDGTKHRSSSVVSQA